METRVCAVCGSDFAPCKPTSTTCSPRCRNTNNARNSAQKRGDFFRGKGEGKTYTKRGGIHEHRAVMEQMLGRPLEPGEIVHHKDHDKRNNDKSNLMLMNQSEHCRKHFTKK